MTKYLQNSGDPHPWYYKNKKESFDYSIIVWSKGCVKEYVRDYNKYISHGYDPKTKACKCKNPWVGFWRIWSCVLFDESYYVQSDAQVPPIIGWKKNPYCRFSRIRKSTTP